MSGRDKAGRVFVVLGSVVLIASAALHCFGGYRMLSLALSASNLNPGLQAALRVVFLSLGWHWVVAAIVALLAGLTETRLRKILILLCGFAMMGFFIGNELIGSAAVLLICGGLLVEKSRAQT
jgi:hypothetical protein